MSDEKTTHSCARCRKSYSDTTTFGCIMCNGTLCDKCYHANLISAGASFCSDTCRKRYVGFEDAEVSAERDQYKSQRDKAVKMWREALNWRITDAHPLPGDKVIREPHLSAVKSVIDECSDKIKEEKE